MISLLPGERDGPRSLRSDLRVHRNWEKDGRQNQRGPQHGPGRDGSTQSHFKDFHGLNCSYMQSVPVLWTTIKIRGCR